MVGGETRRDLDVERRSVAVRPDDRPTIWRRSVDIRRPADVIRLSLHGPHERALCDTPNQMCLGYFAGQLRAASKRQNVVKLKVARSTLRTEASNIQAIGDKLQLCCKS
jgi:hypothetical protein